MNQSVPSPRAKRPLSWFSALIVAFLLVLNSGPYSLAAPATPTKPTVISVGSNAVQVKWTAVSGADKYVVRYSTSSSFSSYKDKSATGTSTVIDALTTGTTYYVKLATSDSTGTSSFSAYASAKPAHQFPAATGLFAENVGGTRIDLTWPNVPYSPGYRVRAYSSGNPTLYFSTITERATLTGLKKGTLYYISVYVEQPPMDGLPALIMSARSSEIKVTTSTYDLASPSAVTLTGQTSSSVIIGWTAPDGMPAAWRFQIKYSLNSAMTSGVAWSGPISGASATLDDLSVDTVHYARVRVIDANGVQRSDYSDLIIAKTLVATGVLNGKISGAPAADVVVAAYDAAGELAQQVDLESDGSYSFVLRPGSYRVHAIYVGTGNYTSRWVSSGPAAVVPSGAKVVPVSLDGTTTAPEVRLGPGGIVGGTVVDPTGAPVPDVDVTALSAVTDEREVIAQAQTDKLGKYTLRGLPAGRYWLRMKYSSDGFLTRSISVSVQEGETSTTNASLIEANFRKTYNAYITGTKVVGKTLTSTATAWLAGSYPTTRATMSVQWKRNGVAIPGATNWTYKLTSADKGKRISVTATAVRYGYKTGSVTSTSYPVS